MKEYEKIARKRSHKIVSDIVSKNPASLRFFRGLGYKKIALFKDYLFHNDIYFYETYVR